MHAGGPVRRRRLGRGDPGGRASAISRSAATTAPRRAPSAPRREAATTAPVAGSSDPAEPTAQANADASTGSEAADLQPKTTSAGPQGLGDVGNLEVASNLVRLRTSITGSAFEQAAGGSAASDPVSLVGRLRALRCAAQLPDGTIVAIGTGRFGTREAIVVATMLADGTTSLDAVVTDPCEVRPLD